jgi:hypothetical protein
MLSGSPKCLSQEEILEHEFSFTTDKRRVANAAGELPVICLNAFPCSPYEISKYKLEHLNADLGHSTIGNPQAARSAERQVENAVASPWSAVGDHNYHRSIGRKISHANSRAERQASVRCSWQIPIE